MNAWGPAILSSGVVGAIVPMLLVMLQRRQGRALADKTDAERKDTLAMAQSRAQETALAAADYRFKQVKDACDQCVNELEDERESRRRERDRDHRTMDALIAAIVEVVPLLDGDASTTKNLRDAIRAARRARYDET